MTASIGTATGAKLGEALRGLGKSGSGSVGEKRERLRESLHLHEKPPTKKRKLTAYNLFVQDTMRSVKQDPAVGQSKAEVMTEISRLWASADKDLWKQRAAGDSPPSAPAPAPVPAPAPAPAHVPTPAPAPAPAPAAGPSTSSSLASVPADMVELIQSLGLTKEAEVLQVRQYCRCDATRYILC